MIPTISTVMVFAEQPFHSLRMMPHTLEKVTFSAIRMQKARVISVGDSVRNPFPSDRPKNWLYHRPQAKAQKMRLLSHTLPFL